MVVTANILRRLRAQPAVNLVMPELRVLQRGKYLLRWRRRLLDYEFSREDAMILSYGSWCVDMVGETIGAEVVVTTDVKLAGLWDQHAEKIERRFARMVSRLKAPYHEATLPVVTTPEMLIQSL